MKRIFLVIITLLMFISGSLLVSAATSVTPQATIDGAGAPVTVDIISASSSNTVTTTQTGLGLFDGEFGATYTQGADEGFYWSGPTDYLEIQIPENSNIWRHPDTYYPWHYEELTILKKEGEDYIDVTSQYSLGTTPTTTWEKFAENLPAGTYRFVRGYTYHMDAEWYIESVEIAPEVVTLNVTANDNSIILNWQDVSVDSYTILRSTTASAVDTIIASNITETSYIDINVEPGVTYYYAVRAVKGNLVSNNSNIVSAVVESNLRVDANSVNTAHIGEEITVDIVLYDGVNICAEDFRVTYDTSLLEYIGYELPEGMALYHTESPTDSELRFILTSMGKDYAVNEEGTLLTLKFKTKAEGEALVDVVHCRVADNSTLEVDIVEEYCGDTIILIQGYGDVNRTNEFTLLDLAIDAWYYGELVENTDTVNYDTDVVVDGIVDDYDLSAIVAEILVNENYNPNNY